MSLLKTINGIEFYLTPNQHWVVSAVYPYYEEMLDLFDFTGADISHGSCTVNGVQQPLVDQDWVEQRSRYKQWLLDIFKQVQVPINDIIERTDDDQKHKAWTINYFAGGWQAGHFHSTDRAQQSNKRFASSVMMFDNIKPKKHNIFNGCMYTILQNPNGYTYEHKFHPEPGRVIVMDDRVWHGAYPTEQNRRVLVWDFDIK